MPNYNVMGVAKAALGSVRPLSRRRPRKDGIRVKRHFFGGPDAHPGGRRGGTMPDGVQMETKAIRR